MEWLQSVFPYEGHVGTVAASSPRTPSTAGTAITASAATRMPTSPTRQTRLIRREGKEPLSNDAVRFLRYTRGRHLDVHELATLEVDKLRRFRDPDPGAERISSLHPVMLSPLKNCLHKQRRKWVEKLDEKHFIGCRVYPDARPDPHLLYFVDEMAPAGAPSVKRDPVISVVVPFYNEEDDTLQRTLVSLAKQQRYMLKERDRCANFRVLLVMDGWFKASKSMKRFVRELFPGKRCYEYLDRLKRFDSGSQLPTTTMILQKQSEMGAPLKVTVGKAKNGQPLKLHIMLMIKADNRFGF